MGVLLLTFRADVRGPLAGVGPTYGWPDVRRAGAFVQLARRAGATWPAVSDCLLKQPHEQLLLTFRADLRTVGPTRGAAPGGYGPTYPWVFSGHGRCPLGLVIDVSRGPTKRRVSVRGATFATPSDCIQRALLLAFRAALRIVGRTRGAALAATGYFPRVS